MREIGSEFWDVPTLPEKGSIFPENTQWYISGRSALQAIIKNLKQYHTVAMPSWCCDSMVKPFADAGIEVQFYSVYQKNSLIQEIRTDCDILFIMDYFGYAGAQPDLSGYKGIVIRDVTHSLFAASVSDADYYFGSLRKWCGVWTGGFAWIGGGQDLLAGVKEDKEYICLRREAMRQKSIYISTPEADPGKSFLSMFQTAEEYLEYTGIAAAAERDKDTAEKLDVGFIRQRRRANAALLMKAFPEMLVFPEMQETDCPLFVPILVPNGKRNKLRQYLISNEIYCPVHWPISKYHKLNEQTEHIYRDELSLVCDQRYTEDDINRMIETVQSFRKEV